MSRIAFASALFFTAAACASASSTPTDEPPPVISLGPTPHDGGSPNTNENDGGTSPDASSADASGTAGARYATAVVRFTPGDCAGFGVPDMPKVVLGPPVGGGAQQGSLDVVSLGTGGEIVLSFGDNAIVDGDGTDFTVFENAFWAGGDANHPNAELGEVSVSDDGETWHVFPCSQGPGPTYGTCAGWHPVYATPDNGISALDPTTSGGDVFDLHVIGVERARFVRIRDMGSTVCPTNPRQKPTSAGFDLDAVAIVHAERP